MCVYYYLVKHGQFGIGLLHATVHNFNQVS